jgi:predicted component of viral defense system (DUF524 family)
VSNDVFEHELSVVNQKIAQLTAKKKAVPEELEDRKMALEMALRLLLFGVESGQVSQEAYLARLEHKIVSEKQLAKALNAQGKKESAIEALRRARIMEKEIQLTNSAADE